MRHIDYGLAFLTAAYLVQFRLRGVRFGPRLPGLAERRKPGGFRSEERFYEIGSTQGLRETAEFLKRPGNAE